MLMLSAALSSSSYTKIILTNIILSIRYSNMLFCNMMFLFSLCNACSHHASRSATQYAHFTSVPQFGVLLSGMACCLCFCHIFRSVCTMLTLCTIFKDTPILFVVLSVLNTIVQCSWSGCSWERHFNLVVYDGDKCLLMSHCRHQHSDLLYPSVTFSAFVLLNGILPCKTFCLCWETSDSHWT